MSVVFNAFDAFGEQNKVRLKLGIRRADRRVHRLVHGRVIFVKIGTHTKFDLVNKVLGLDLLS